MPTTTVPEIQVVNGVAEGEGDGPAPPEGDAPPGDPFKTTPVIRGQLMGYPVQYWSPKTAQEELDETEAAIEAELLVDGGDEDDIILLLERQCVGASLDHLVPEDLSRPDVTLRVPKGQRRPKHVGRPSSLHITPGYLSTPVGEGEGLEGAVGEDRSASLPPSTKQGLKERFLGKRKRKIPWWLVWLVRKRRKAAKKGKAEGEEEEPKVQGSTSPVFYPEGSGKARLATPEQFEHPDGTPHAEAKIKAKVEAPDLHIAAGVEPTKIPLSKGRSLDTTLSPGKVSPELPPLDRMVSAPTGKADIELSPLKRSHETPDLAGLWLGTSRFSRRATTPLEKMLQNFRPTYLTMRKFSKSKRLTQIWD
ncbi:PREDICTED: uncharacterized protein LOC109462172 [Branchiostoma belcheri]|uniref:Uncharacterized protein LOC109462172 n=1 Tax=Branchiostoma belcheri TaxID=7741 RepID=A0A6P4XUB8_BRABE|nr:PREDICTED: uncharacterized protein LOC109462172 [Branchiostoma belcheri]XP_019614229.1 PREDICTED: uncharacterized protein LOC109462172 [Branchiostoma belcheri]XP_019614230.1 PREDICTED: uncharacterized protein LOC109462172 [Branchiostoma belcheri]